MTSDLTEAQACVARRVLDDEGSRRRHLVVALSGAHAYGFPSPDSDLDLKALHVEPTEHLIGLTPRETHPLRMEVIGGVEIDYSSNEIQPALLGILQGNGNYVERVLGPFILVSSPAHAALIPLVTRALSRRLHRHYRGFATGMLRELTAAPTATAKKILYVIRAALTGAHLLATGHLVTDVTVLLEDHGLGAARELVELKRAGERTPLSETLRSRWTAEVQRAFAALDGARERSCLPEEPPNRDELDAWLIELRRASFTPLAT